MKKNNVNICSIYHSKFKKLIQLLACARKAQLMDYILLGWQTSTYKLKNSSNKWFMKPQAQIAEDTGIALSTLQSYLKNFEKEGFIERRQALYSRTTDHNIFEVKKGSYITVTDKFLNLLNPNHELVESNTWQQQDSNTKKQYESLIISTEIEEKLKANCSISNKNKGIENLNSRGLYIRDLYKSHNNNIKLKQIFNSVDKPTLIRLMNQYEVIQNYVATKIKEEIPEEIKKLILGTFFNLTFEHKKQFSSPQQVVAEYLFSLINTQYCLPQVTDFKHRNHILAKTLRSNNWRTPKGFYKHFYLAQNFKDKHEIKQKQWQDAKEREMKQQSNSLVLSPDDAALERVETQIMEKGSLIEELTQSIYRQKSEEQITVIREQINKLRTELKVLYDEQRNIEQDLEKEEGKTIKMCA